MEGSAKKRNTNKSEKAKAYFELIREENLKKTYQCKICSKEVSGTKASNLTSHLRVHPNIHKELDEPDFSLEHKRKFFLLNCVEIVSVNGRAFRCLTDSGILGMNEDILEKFRIAGREVNLRDPHLTEIKQTLLDVAEEVRKKIRMDARNRPLSLMVDIVSSSRSILGVSIQYMNNGKHVIRSIGMIELKESHTGIYIAKLITDRLKELEIDLNQIVTITTDNGANVLKMVRDMENHLQKEMDDAKNHTQTLTDSTSKDSSESESFIDVEEEAINGAIRAALNNDNEITDEIAYAMLYCDLDGAKSDDSESNNNALLTAITSDLTNVHGLNIIWNIIGINCAAHTLQLVIFDAFESTTEANRDLIILCRRVVKVLRLDSTMRELKNSQIDEKMPRIDVATRWGSSYLMVSF